MFKNSNGNGAIGKVKEMARLSRKLSAKGCYLINPSGMKMATRAIEYGIDCLCELYIFMDGSHALIFEFDVSEKYKNVKGSISPEIKVLRTDFFKWNKYYEWKCEVLKRNGLL